MPRRPNPQRRRKGKRWYFDARIGRNVPIIGGTGLRLGSRNLNKVVRRQVIKNEETKEKVQLVFGGGLKHGTVYNMRLNDIQQGTAGDQRIGDKVFYCGITLKMVVVPASIISSSFWRFYIVKHRDTSSTTNATSLDGVSPPIGSSLLFRGGFTGMNSLLNSDNVNIICSKTLKIDPRYSGEANVSRMFKMNCKIMKRFQFRTGGTQEGEYFNYYLVVVPLSNTSGQTAIGTTTVGDVSINVEQVYKDA